MVTIFGKDTCPYTRAAREDYTDRGIPFEYVNVKTNAEGMARMLRYTDGRRDVPVIVDGDEVTIGFGGT
ncbi:MAG TPA: UXX-star (seleno)protein family 1 [Vicinamibacterales bacterium]|jgi:glutaredoxin 3|nr:UXX-star (seleno)protein family 1 [Vicinamibacterales bacterium]